MTLVGILETVSEDIWYIPLVLIVLLGIYSTIRLRGVQITGIGEMVRATFRRDEGSDKPTPFQVFCMSMGNRIGVGNITGPVLAITVGGPGAIFWMWVFAFLGTATSFLETTVGQLYKSRKSDGKYHGGPAFNIRKGLGMRRMSLVVAFIMVLMYILGFVSMEVSSMSEALDGAFGCGTLVIAVVLTILTAYIVLGGMTRVARLSEAIVPAMGILWLIICCVCIALSDGGIVDAFSMIFGYAFSIPSAIGGGIGAMLIIGMKRGVLSNEAGVGTITNISSMANVSHPVRQGYSQALGVIIDTIVSTLTALVVLSFGDFDSIWSLYQVDDESVNLLQGVMEASIGDVAPYIVALFLFIFAFTSLMSDYVIGENNLLFITKSDRARAAMCLFLLAVVFLSSFYASDALFAIVDILLAVCGIINCLVMFRIGGRAVEAFRDYRRQKEEGIEIPEFHKENIRDNEGLTEWERRSVDEILDPLALPVGHLAVDGADHQDDHDDVALQVGGPRAYRIDELMDRLLHSRRMVQPGDAERRLRILECGLPHQQPVQDGFRELVLLAVKLAVGGYSGQDEVGEQLRRIDLPAGHVVDMAYDLVRLGLEDR